MTQPQYPGQPFPQQPSASSAPAPATGQYAAQGQYAQPGQAQAPYAGAPVQGASGESFVSNLMNSTRAFAAKYGNLLFIVAMVAYGLDWFFDVILAVMNLANDYGTTGADIVRFFSTLIVGAAAALVQLFIFRMIIELVRNTAPKGEGPQA